VISEANERIQKIRTRFEEVVGENKNLKSELNEKIKELEDLHNRIDLVNREKSDLEMTRTELEKKLEEMSRLNEDLKNKVDETEKKSEELIAMINELSGQIDQLEESNAQ
jgi:predicted nuclease with TOPRIM domain